MDIRQVQQFKKIDGDFRSPLITEDGKILKWNNTTGFFDYIDDIYVVSFARETAADRMEATMSDGSKLYLALGALAWEDDVDALGYVKTVFGRSPVAGAIVAEAGDYDASQVTDAFDKTGNTLDDIAEGTTNKHFTATYKTNVDLNTAARHTHTNKAILDGITNVGSGKIITDYERALIYSHVGNDAEFIRDTVADFIQDGMGITWSHNDPANTLTPTVSLVDFTTDNLAEGTLNEYYTENKVRNAISLTVTAPGLDVLIYNEATGEFTHTPVTTSQVRAAINATYPVQYAPASGTISIDTAYFDTITAVPEIVQVSQVLHGFAENDAIRLDSGTSTWVKAQADTSANAGTIGVVKQILSPNVFTYQYAGILARNPNPFDLGVTYFLSNATAGLITTEPTFVLGEVRQYIGTGVAEGLLLEIDLGHEITAFELPDYPSGTVTSIVEGDGMEFAEIVSTGVVTMGLPSDITSTGVNSVATHTHTHALANSGATAGTFTNATITVDVKGIVTNAESGTPMSNVVETNHSIMGDGSIGDPIQLIGDEPTPDPYTYYGTDFYGNRGFHPISLLSERTEDREAGFADIVAGTPQSYDLDMYAAWDYVINYAVLRTDVGTLSGVAIKINGTSITGLDALTVTDTNSTPLATALNTVSKGDIVTVETSGTDSGTPTYLGVKIVTTRL